MLGRDNSSKSIRAKNAIYMYLRVFCTRFPSIATIPLAHTRMNNRASFFFSLVLEDTLDDLQPEYKI